MIQRPQAEEHPTYFARYIALVEEGDALDQMRAHEPGVVRAFASLTPEQQLYRYAPGKWNPKDILAHIVDTERGMSYRAMCIARGDTQNLPFMDEDLFAEQARATDRSMESLIREYQAVRQATIALFEESIPTDRLSVIGTVNGNPMSARALAWIIAGHEIHHCMILSERYVNA